MTAENVQVAPYPAELAALVASMSYRAHEGWTVELREVDRDRVDGRIVGHGLTLVVTTEGYDSYHPEHGRTYGVHHYFIVPAATYNRDAWKRWLLDRMIDVETHEACEHFVIKVDVCGHCGKLDEPDGEHSCDCPGTIATGCGHEFDRTVRDDRPFAPLHGDGANPYVVHQYATDVERRTRPGGRIVSD